MPERFLLVLPPIPRGVQYPLSIEHLGLCALAANLRRAGIPCHLLDAFCLGLDRDTFIGEIGRQIREEGVEVIGFSVMAEEFLDATIEAATRLRQRFPGVFLVAGGPFPTFRPGDLLQRCRALDGILRGEADETILMLAEAIAGRRPLATVPGWVAATANGEERGPFPFEPPDPEALPDPTRDFARIAVARHGALSMSTSRGCDFRCRFCGIPGFSGRRREKSAGRVVDEVRTLVASFRPRRITMVDPTFIGSGPAGRQRFAEIGRRLAELRLPIRFDFEVRSSQVERESFAVWKQAGLDCVHLGIESGFPATLRRFKKGETVATNARAVRTLRELGIGVTAGFIMFHPWTTLPEIRANLDFLRDNPPDNPVSPILNAMRMYAGAPLADAWDGPFAPGRRDDGYFLSPPTREFFDRINAPDAVATLTRHGRAGEAEGVLAVCYRILEEIAPEPDRAAIPARRRGAGEG